MILVDIHEQRSKVPGLLGAESIVVSLDTGDYSFKGWDNKIIAIERKSVNNLLSSISSGELADQLGRMLENIDVPILLIEGDIKPDPRTGYAVLDGHMPTRFNYDAIVNHIHVWQLRGMLIERTRSETDTAHRILSLAKMYAENKSVPSIKRKRHLDFSSKKDPVLNIVAAFPGIGTDRAKSLLRTHGTLQQLCCSSKDELRAAPGIGETAARTVYDLSHKIWQEV